MYGGAPAPKDVMTARPLGSAERVASSARGTLRPVLPGPARTPGRTGGPSRRRGLPRPSPRGRSVVVEPGRRARSGRPRPSGPGRAGSARVRSTVWGTRSPGPAGPAASWTLSSAASSGVGRADGEADERGRVVRLPQLDPARGRQTRGREDPGRSARRARRPVISRGLVSGGARTVSARNRADPAASLGHGARRRRPTVKGHAYEHVDWSGDGAGRRARPAPRGRSRSELVTPFGTAPPPRCPPSCPAIGALASPRRGLVSIGTAPADSTTAGSTGAWSAPASGPWSAAWRRRTT